MNFCYCDESGTGDEPIATMVGVVVDAGRMHVTKQHWAELLELLSQVAKRPVVELKTADFYRGNGLWHDLDGEERSQIINDVFDWLSARKHSIVYASVVKEAYYDAIKADRVPHELNTPWRFMGFHLMLAMQRACQKEKKNKGHTLYIFDNAERERVRFADIVARPGGWSDEYYGRGKKQERLDQVIDAPYFGDSIEVPLLQIADFLAYFLRRYAEIKEGLVPPRYEDEEEKISEWASGYAGYSIGRAHIYPKRVSERREAHQYFYELAPPSIRDL